ncbi:MAG: HD domain-containing protein [Bacteroidales bacterium]|nr:HD domain-containing protein [Bacteroidales bacterium]
MSDELQRYVYDELVPRYASFDQAHREDHALTVISQAMSLADGLSCWLSENPDAGDIWRVPVDKDVLLVAAACHDLGLVNGRERHHLDSGIIIRADRRLRQWFDEAQIELIAQAAEDHRASGKSTPRSIYGMLVAEADRVIEGETIIRRTIQYGLKNYPDLDREGHVVRAIGHLREKYGRGGYLKLWIPWSDNAMRLSRLQDIIADDTSVRQEVERIFDTI